ncbi:MAG: transcription termination/antitermination protein NusA [Deltaproteobacteria bacterium]|jgi:N utilization substance protein A|nr:transcription termination/antitermination protein NusA [Deltaproteobacteria bacterium]
MEGENLNNIISQVATDKGIAKDILVEALEAAMLTAARKVYGIDRDIEAHFNPNSGDVELFEFRTVVEKIDNAATQILPDDAHAHDPDCQIGDSLGFKIEKADLGRIAAQTAKQVIIQRVREAERENVFNDYADRKEELVTGIVRRFERGNIIVDLGRAEAVLPLREQCPRESYRMGDRIQAYVVDVNKQARGSQIVLSRTSPGLLIKLFEMEVPEIAEGIVKIEAAAREPGARSKIAVSSSDRDVDPVGACVGMKGSRVQAVVQELRGEKVDIVPYDEDTARFVCSALAPAEVSRVLVDEANHAMEIIVPDDQLSLAIGRRGQNVRLASQLTGWRLDIVSESKVKEIKDRAFKSLGRMKGVNDIHMQTLYNFGIRCAQDVLDSAEGFLTGIPGIGADMAKRLRTDAVRVVEEEQAELEVLKKEEEQRAREQAKAMFSDQAERHGRLPEAERLIRVTGIGVGMLPRLEAAGIHSVEDLVQIADLRRVAERADLPAEKLDQLRHAATVYVDKEVAGVEVAPSSEDAGPEVGYAPSPLLEAAKASA